MKSKVISLVTMMLLMCASVNARTLTLREATAVAQNRQLESAINANTRSVKLSDVPQVAYTVMDSKSAEPALWVFNYAHDAGYAVVAADDLVANLVLGYCDNGNIDATAMPENMKWWLSEYARQIEYLRNNPEAAGGAYTRAFSGNVEPLIKSKWNQGNPYNLQCPELNGSLSVTGCVATATAQIMYYHKHPAQATGSNSYNWAKGGKVLSADFSNVTFDWANMTDTYSANSTTAQKDAVATLMKNVGYASNMNYSPEASGTQSVFAARALVNNFGYSEGIGCYYRDFISLPEFESVMVEELNAKRPMYFSGATLNNEGHAYVCDGYNSAGYFHINWGWGGMSDGYFLTTALGPDAQGIGGASDAFNYRQQIYTKIMPADGAAERCDCVGIYGNFYTSNTSAKRGDNIYIRTSSFYNNGIWTAQYVIGAGIYTADGELLSAQAISGNLTIQATDNYYHPVTGLNASFTIPSGIQSGKYQIRPLYRKYNETEWKPLGVLMNYLSYIDMTVDGNTATFSRPTYGTLEAANVTVQGELKHDATYHITAEISNVGDLEYYGQTTLAFRTSSSATENIAVSDVMLVDLMGKSSGTYTFVGAAPTIGGNYYVVVLDKALNVIGGAEVNVEKGAPEVISASASTIENPNIEEATYTAHLYNYGSDYKDKLYLWLYKGTGKTMKLVGSYEKEVDIAAEDGVVDVDIDMKIVDGVAGATYTCVLVWNDNGSNKEVETQRNTRKTFVLSSNVGVSDVTVAATKARGVTGAVEVTAAEATRVSIYAITGQLLKDIAVDGGTTTIDMPRGIYVVRVQGGSTHKVIVK